MGPEKMPERRKISDSKRPSTGAATQLNGSSEPKYPNVEQKEPDFPAVGKSLEKVPPAETSPAATEKAGDHKGRGNKKRRRAKRSRSENKEKTVINNRKNTTVTARR